MSRLFYALWPDSKTRSNLSDVCTQIDRGRLIAPQNLHITLLFLGRVDNDIRQRLSDETDDIPAKHFQFQLSGSGWWKRSGVLWLAPAHIPEQLYNLADRLAAIAARCNLSIEDRPYRPHVSLARKILSPMDLEFEPISWEVRDFCLVESTTLPSGAEYKIIHTWPLT
jgi:RNA 2',3'-cyclic 3'-phosphodiesterase